MSNNKWNILVTINERYLNYLQVMLTSLFINNSEKCCIYCLHTDLGEMSRTRLCNYVKKYGNEIVFLPVDASAYQGFPATENLTIECYYILLAHKILPQNMDRILYLDCDLIVEGNVSELYDVAFENNYLAVCGQSYKQIEGNYYKIGARPERGEYFNSGVMVFNLPKFREEIGEKTYLDAARAAGYRFELADQGILNLVFENKVKYLDTLKYNFRISIYEDYVKDGNKKEINPAIIHYVMRDYYKIGYGMKPWDLLFTEQEYRLFELAGIVPEKYELRRAVAMNLWMQKRWWHYAKKSAIYSELKKQMEENKRKIIRPLLEKSIKQAVPYRKQRQFFENISRGIIPENMGEFKKIKYRELEKYIDSIAADKAIRTMRNLFRWNCENLRKEKNIKIAFLVYSSAEWQCEDLYRKFEQDERFEPIIVICGYSHGTSETIRETYVKTCAYFRESGRMYNMEYAGYCDRQYYNGVFDSFHILIYISPFNGMCPYDLNCANRNIAQLCVHIPYGFGYFAENKEDTYYGEGYYEQTVFKLCWFFFCACGLDKKIASALQRMKGYNIRISGCPKIDALTGHTFSTRKDLWKNDGNCVLKIIWAPHFNLRKGMNGTFHKNYRWFYQFAHDHQEISWIVRPHPRMECGALENGIVNSHQEYRDYLNAWEALPNASVIEGGDYYDIFDTSDIMILDSLSFLEEYQFTGKPLLWLEADPPRAFTKWGERLLSVSYKVKGDDFIGIQNFIDKAIKKIDPKKIERESFRKKYMECKENHDSTATEFIYEAICSSVFSETCLIGR